MKNTTSNFLTFLQEKEDKEPKRSVDKSIFTKDLDGNIVMRDSVRAFFASAADKIDEMIPILGSYVTGDILRNIYTETSSIDLTVIVNRDGIDDVIHDRMIGIVNDLNGMLVSDTRHRLLMKIMLVNNDVDISKWMSRNDVIFDIEKNKFIKNVFSAKDDTGKTISFIEKNEPDDLVNFDRKNPIEDSIFSLYSKRALERIKTVIKSKMFDLVREANGIASNTIEKSFAKKVSSDEKINTVKLKDKFIQNEVSEQMAICLLKISYYQEIMDMISAIKANQNVQSDFEASLSEIKVRQESTENKVHPTFSEFVVLTEGNKKRLKKLKTLADLAKPGKAAKAHAGERKDVHRNLGMDIRSMQRKKLRQLAAYRELTTNPSEEISDEFSCREKIEKAKRVTKGFWPISYMQARWVASVYHFDLPTSKDRIKRLSNMPMALFKPRRGGYFLIKDERLLGLS